MSGEVYGDSTYNRAPAYTRTDIQIGESPIIFSETYQHLDVNSRYFIHPKILIALG